MTSSSDENNGDGMTGQRIEQPRHLFGLPLRDMEAKLGTETHRTIEAAGVLQTWRFLYGIDIRAFYSQVIPFMPAGKMRERLQETTGHYIGERDVLRWSKWGWFLTRKVGKLETRNHYALTVAGAIGLAHYLTSELRAKRVRTEQDTTPTPEETAEAVAEELLPEALEEDDTDLPKGEIEHPVQLELRPQPTIAEQVVAGLQPTNERIDNLIGSIGELVSIMGSRPLTGSV